MVPEVFTDNFQNLPSCSPGQLHFSERLQLPVEWDYVLLLGDSSHREDFHQYISS